MSILVTGASGNVGRYVIKELIRMNEPAVAAGTDPNKLQQKGEKFVRAVKLDLTDPDTYAAALDGVDRVFLMRPPHLGSPEDLYPFIDALKTRPIRLIVFLSLMGIEKNPMPPHYKIEKYIERSGIPYVHVRPGFFMQNMSRVHAKEIKEDNRIFIPAGHSRTSFIDAADIGLAIATLLHEPEKFGCTAYTLTGPEALTYDQVAEILSEVTQRRIVYAKPGFLKYRKYYIQQRGLDKAYVNVTVGLYLMTRLGTAQKVTSDFKQLTGRNPRTFKAFAAEHADCF